MVYISSTPAPPTSAPNNQSTPAPSQPTKPSGRLPLELWAEVFTHTDSKTFLALRRTHPELRNLPTALQLHSQLKKFGWRPPHCPPELQADTKHLTGLLVRRLDVVDNIAAHYLQGGVLSGKEYLFAGAEAHFSTNGRFIATLYTSRGMDAMKVWDMRQRPPVVMTFRDVHRPSFSPDGNFMATTTPSGRTAKVWNLGQTPPTATILSGHSGEVFDASFSPAGRFLLTRSADKTVKLWDIQLRPPSATTLGDQSETIPDASFSPDGRFVLTTSGDNTAKVWNIQLRPPSAITLSGHQDVVRHASFSPDGNFVYTASEDRTAKIWNLRQKPPTAVTLAGNERGLLSAFSHDGRHVITLDTTRVAKRWDLKNQPLEGVELGKVDPKAFSHDGRFCVLKNGKYASVFDFQQPLSFEDNPVNLGRHQDDISTASISPDGRFVVTVAPPSWQSPPGDYKIKAFDMQRKRPAELYLKGQQSFITTSFSPDGRFVVISSWDLYRPDHTVKLYDLHEMFRWKR